MSKDVCGSKYKNKNHKTTTRNVAVYSSYMTTIDYSFTYSWFRTTAFSYSSYLYH